MGLSSAPYKELAMSTDASESLSEFQRDPEATLTRLAESGEAAMLTVNGEPRAVVQDAVAYRQLLDAVERAEILLAVQEGLEEVARGEGFELEEAD
jgi:PHD/YefM family antitoxin component YafN of YafNO toxin-antitoxin module